MQCERVILVVRKAFQKE
uniref:Uncharacterized protein n=1 Tax=Arundo donax TaxID=35708 RepID=A0A0A8ZEJ2_ARUDO